MRRRDVLVGLAGAGGAIAGSALAQEAEPARKAGLLGFPMTVVPGREALAYWEHQRASGKVAVMIGPDDALAEAAEAARWAPAVEVSLGDAATLAFPDALFAHRARELAEAEEWLKDNPLQIQSAEDFFAGVEPAEGSTQTIELDTSEPRGPWPERVELMFEPLVLRDPLSNNYRPRIHIAELPTARAYEAPAWLGFGGYNLCPPTAIHVAALRHWAKVYGAEPVVIGSDRLELRVRRRPESRDEAIALAQIQYAYCADVIDQGVETIEALAASLMASDWWYFWWD